MTVTSVIPDRDPFVARVDMWVRDGLGSGVATFEDLLARLPGVYPSVVMESARRIALLDPSLARILERILQGTENHRDDDRARYQIELPMPHPLDYDWRFADQTVDQLLAECEKITNSSQKVALLGAPTVFWAAHERALDRQTVLFDASGITVDLLAPLTSGRALKCDLLVDPLPQFMANAVIADPPWYPDEMGVFLWAAAKLSVVGGQILMSLPPIGTRPTIESERNDLIAWSQQLGLRLVKIEPSALMYQSPVFEINALRVEGIPKMSGDWRRGDLAQFSLETKVEVLRPVHSSSIQAWVEECVHGVRWRVRREEGTAFDDPQLISIVSGDVLPSVSKRDARRMQADVWTSGNRVFRCVGKHTLRLILRAVRDACEPQLFFESEIGRTLSATEASVVRTSYEQIKKIVELERNENLLFKGK